MKLRSGDPWMPAEEYSRTLKGLSVNLLVQDIEKSLDFHQHVLAASVVYSDPDFAVIQGYGAEWMLHADHTYDDHPMRQALATTELRGAGAELRLHGRDPDQAEAAAIKHGFTVLATAEDKPHGVREVFISDPDGYTWVLDIPSGQSEF